MYSRAKASLFALLVCVMVLVATPASAAPKISVTPVNATLAPAQSVSVSFALDEPIICQVSPPCDVVLNFSASQRLGVTMTPNVVTWTQVEFRQTRNVIVTFDAPTPAIQSQTVTLTATAVSNAQFYNGFAVSFPVNVVVPTPTPTPSPSPTPTPTATPTPTPSDSLAQTGASVEVVPWGAGILGLGVVAAVGATYLRRRLQRH
jgi:hypothetical protein